MLIAPGRLQSHRPKQGSIKVEERSCALQVSLTQRAGLRGPAKTCRKYTLGASLMEASLLSGCRSGKLAAHCGKGEPGVLRTGLYVMGHPRRERVVGSLEFSSVSGFLFA